MSKKYNEYLSRHINAVQQAADWLYSNSIIDCELDLSEHDLSKYSKEEYGPYDRHFYPDEAGKGTDKEFKEAWKHHYENNPHHWEYWLTGDEQPIPMPKRYVVEMVCDEMAFGFIKGNLRDILKFQMEHRKEMKLHPATAILLDHYLSLINILVEPYTIKDTIDVENFLMKDIQESLRIIQMMAMVNDLKIDPKLKPTKVVAAKLDITEPKEEAK